MKNKSSKQPFATSSAIRRLCASLALALTLSGVVGVHSAVAAETMTKDLIRINRADAETLQKLHGVGKTIARRIIERRERLGGFKALEQLIEVRGISRRLIDRNRKRISLD